MHPGNFLKNPHSRRDSFLVNHCGDEQVKQPVSLISSLAKIHNVDITVAGGLGQISSGKSKSPSEDWEHKYKTLQWTIKVS